MLYNYQVNNSPKIADLIYFLGETKIIDRFTYNLGNLKHILSYPVQIIRQGTVKECGELRHSSLLQVIYQKIWTFQSN